MSGRFTKLISTLLCYFLLFEQSGFAQVAGALDISGHLAQLHNSLFPDKFRPLHLRYLSYDNIANSFKLLLDKGDLKNLRESALTDTTKTLLNYFFVGVTLPNESFWVNLRPDSEDNVIDEELAKTDVGKILLEADLQLKKDTAGFTSPETPQGKEYWDKLYKKAEQLFGSENITIPTLTRPWIVPNEIIIRETENNAYIYKATLKVMLEEDYLKGNATYNFKDERFKTLNEYSSQLLRELVIPKLTKEVNSTKRYAPLRQVYYSLIMAQWFKTKFYGKGGLYSWLIDKKNLNGLTSQTPWSKTTYFREYQKSFQQGEYNLNVPVYTNFGQSLRSHMSGGMDFTTKIKTAIELSGGMVVGSPGDLSQNNKYLFPVTVRGGGINNIKEIVINLGNSSSVLQQDQSPKKREKAGLPSDEKGETASSAVGSNKENNFKSLKQVLSDLKIPVELPETSEELTPNLMLQIWLAIAKDPRAGENKEKLRVNSLYGFILLFNDSKEFIEKVGEVLTGEMLVLLKRVTKEIEKKIESKDLEEVVEEIHKVSKEEPLLQTSTYQGFKILENFDISTGDTFPERIINRLSAISGIFQLAEFFLLSEEAMTHIKQSLLDIRVAFNKLCLKISAQNLRERLLIWGETVNSEVFKKIADEIIQDKELTEDLKWQYLREFLIRIIEDSIVIMKDDDPGKSQSRLLRDIFEDSRRSLSRAAQLKQHLEEYILRYKNSIMPLSELAISILNDLRKSGIDIENLKPVFKGCLIPMVFEAITNFWKDSKKQSRPIKDNAKNHLRPIIKAFQKIPENDLKSQQWFWKDLIYFMERSILELTEDENKQLKSRQLNSAFAKLGMDEEKQSNKPPPSASSAVESLEEKSPGAKFHGTYVFNIDQILKDGLLPAGSTHKDMTVLSLYNSHNRYGLISFYEPDHPTVSELKILSSLRTSCRDFVFNDKVIGLIIKTNIPTYQAAEKLKTDLDFYDETYTDQPIPPESIIGLLVSKRMIFKKVADLWETLFNYGQGDEIIKNKLYNAIESIALTGNDKDKVTDLIKRDELKEASRLMSIIFAEQLKEKLKIFERDILLIDYLGYLSKAYNLPVYDHEGNEILTKPTDIGSTASSAMEVRQAAMKNAGVGVDEKGPGGVDFRALPIVSEPVGNLISPVSRIPYPVSSLNLDEEWGQIQNMLNAGIIPSSQRLKEFLEASCESVDCAERTEDALGIIADILRLEEERVAVTEPALRELLVLLESDKPANELQLALSKITVLPKIPQRN